MAQELAIRDSVGGVPQVQTIAQHFVKSGFFKDTRDLSQAVVKIMAGAEMGFGPFASMKGVDIIEGKPAISAGLMAAAVRRGTRYDYRVLTHTETECSIEFRMGREVLGVSTFTVENAKAAGLWDKPGSVWKRYTRNMLFARAMSNGVRFHCPDVFAGPVYTPEELGADVDEDGAMIVEAQAAPMIRMVDPATAEVALPGGGAGTAVVEMVRGQGAEPAQTNAERVKAELKARVEELQLLAAASAVELPDVTQCKTVREVKQWIADAEKAIPEPF